MSQALSVPVPPPPQAYLQRPLLVYLILGSFVVLTLPLCLLALRDPELVNRWYVGGLYVVLLGTTHFVLTFTVYLQSNNLRYFNSSWRNRMIYFAAPLAIFIFFDLYSALQLRLAWPLFGLLIGFGVRVLDFQHFNRQSYGVLQLFKGRSKVQFPAWMRQVENAYFMGLTGLLLLSFASEGHFDPSRPLTLALVGCVLILFGVLAVGFVGVWRRAPDRRVLWTPLGYFLLQSAAAALAVYSTALYVFCLAMHYVEYHVLMAPRCFNSKLDPGKKVDQLFGELRKSKVVFYGVLILLALVAFNTAAVGMGMAAMERTDGPGLPPYLVLISLFDGLFVFHYFVEMFIWKFSDPYYRQTLGPLYFGQKPAPAAGPG